MRMKRIYEVPVYCGSQKVWRILNLNTGTIYSMDYDTEEQAFANIEEGEQRGDHIVRGLHLIDVHNAVVLDAYCDSSMK